MESRSVYKKVGQGLFNKAIWQTNHISTKNLCKDVGKFLQLL